MNSLDKMEDFKNLIEMRDKHIGELEQRIAELERKLEEQQVITQQAIALIEPLKNYLPAEHVNRWITCVTSPAQHFDAVLAQAREEGRKDTSRDAERYQYIRSDGISDNQADRIAGIIRDNYGEELDAAIDAEMLASAPNP